MSEILKMAETKFNQWYDKNKDSLPTSTEQKNILEATFSMGVAAGYELGCEETREQIKKGLFS